MYATIDLEKLCLEDGSEEEDDDEGRRRRRRRRRRGRGRGGPLRRRS
jgi:hypothetical protein